MKLLKINAYTTGLAAPSARYRVRQLIPYLYDKGIKVDEFYSKAGAFPPKAKVEQLPWAIRNVSENILKVLNQPKADVTWLQKVMLSKHYTLERYLNRPIVFDVDDAIHLRNRGSFTERIANISNTIICGNNFLADYYSKLNSNIHIIPTAVDLSKYKSETISERNYNYILWTGTSSGFPFVYHIEKALKIIVDRYKFIKIKIVSNEPPQFKILKKEDYVFEYWSETIEFSSITSSSIGIMPLFDSDDARGKCSYKMLCYMAAKLPVVVSPVGMNAEVLQMGNIGFGARDIDEWVDALDGLITSTSQRIYLGENAYRLISQHFDVKVISDKLHKVFFSI